MTKEPTRKDVARFRAECKRDGMDLSTQSDEQVARQLKILRGGLYAPNEKDLAEIRDRAATTEAIFRKNDHHVIELLKKALQDLRSLESPVPARPRKGGRKRPEDPLMPRLRELGAALVPYPPSLLRPELQKALGRIAAWTTPSLDQKKRKTKPPTTIQVIEELRRCLESITG